MKAFIIIYLTLANFVMVQGQNMDQHIFSSSGQSFTTSKVQVDFTIGEAKINTITSTSAIQLTQGFHQTKLSTISIKPTSFNTLRAYPNPTTGIVYVEHQMPITQLEVTDMSGKVILVKTGTTQSIDLNALSRGVYNLRVITSSASHVGTFRIVKL